MYHSVTVVGRLGRDPEMRYTPDGQAVTTFSVAADRTYAGKDGQRVQEPLWFRVTVFGASAAACNQHLSSGKTVLVEGRLSTDGKSGGPRIWQGKDGTWRSGFEIVASTVRFLSRKDDDATASPSAAAGEA